MTAPSHTTTSSGLTPEDRSLIRMIAGRLRQIFQGKFVESEDVDRRDELGILANMVNRAARELNLGRQRDAAQRQELEQRLAELREAHATQQQLLNTIVELSSPVLEIYKGIILLPIIGALDSARAQHVVTTLLEHTARVQAQIVILDITGVPTVDTQVADALLRATRAAGLLGARTILCGVTPEVAQVVVALGIDLSMLTPCRDLQSALARALALRGYRIAPR